MKKIYFLRHARTEKHPEVGYTLDELDEEGSRLTKELAESDVPLGNLIISSPNKRAKETARIISEIRKIPLGIVQNWREANRGTFQKKPYEEFLKEWYKFDLDYGYIPPGGESVSQFRMRIIEGLEGLLATKKDVLCITHSGVISNVLMMLYGFEFNKTYQSRESKVVLTIKNGDLVLYPQDNPLLEIERERIFPITELKAPANSNINRVNTKKVIGGIKSPYCLFPAGISLKAHYF